MTNKQSLQLYLFLIVSIFAVSVSFRLKHINQPLGRHHEWITAHTLLTLKVWEKEGASTYFFSPVYSYNYPEDKKVGVLGGISDVDGNDYYVSYGPFAFIFPYFVFKILNVSVSVTSLQVFNLAIHFISAFLILLSIQIVYNRKLKDGVFLPAIIGYSVYLFIPSTLWFQGNVYFSDTLVQLFFISGIYFTLRLLFANAIRNSDLLGLSISVFLGVYTEWLALFFAFTVFIVFCIKGLKNKVYFKPALLTVFCVTIALLLIAFQYAQITGLEKFITYWLEKYTLRSGAFGKAKSEYGYSIGNMASYKYLDKHYNDNYLNVFNLFAFILPAFVLISLFKKKYFISLKEGSVILIAALPVFLHHSILFNFTAVHDFSTLKTAILLTFIIAFVCYHLLRFSSDYLKEKQIYFQALLLTFVGVKCYHGFKKFESRNNLKTINAYFWHVGRAMNEYGKTDETIATSGLVCPEMMYYSGRNPVFALTSNDVKNIASWTNQSVLWAPYQKDNPIRIKLIRYFPNGDSTLIK